MTRLAVRTGTVRCLAIVAMVVLVIPGCDDDRDPRASRSASPTQAPSRTGSPAEVPSPAPASSEWLVITDVHFDPFADPSLVPDLVNSAASGWAAILAEGGDEPAGYGADTNATLLQSALQSMSEEVGEPEVVFVLGDLLAHDFSDSFDRYAPNPTQAGFESFVDKTVEYVRLELAVTFPESQFVPVIGNNDSYCGDYESTPGSPFFSRYAAAWEPMVDRGGAAPGFVRTFSKGGYYQARLPGEQVQSVLALNSVYWSSKYANSCGRPGTQPGAQELDWATRAVAASTRRLWMASHVPPGIDVFATVRSPAPVLMLAPGYQESLLDLLDQPSRWTLALHGHVHMDAFRLLSDSSSEIPTEEAVASVGAPSISPVFGNNPAYLVFRMDASRSSVEDYSAFALDLTAPASGWTEEYSFTETYGVDGVDARSYVEVLQAIRDPSPAQTAFQRHYTSGSAKGGIAGQFRSYWCGTFALTGAAFATCVKDGSG